MKCNFIKYNKQDKNGKEIFICDKCGYKTIHGNALKICGPILQTDKELSLLKKIGNFTLALGKHLYKGMPTVNDDTLRERLEICKNCPLFKKKGLTGGICTHESCGCSIQDEIVFLNKLAWKDQECPLNKW